MNISTRQQDDTLILSIEEERLDAHNSPELREFVLKLLGEGQIRFILDLSGVSFVDSSGLGVLLSGYKNVNLQSGRFCLTGLHPRVQAMFELTRLDQVFEIHASLNEALTHT
ncbi:STAS domain-containing protein [Candidatus Woesearchaeota archaeon]|nr:STAS domain-containing protein [Candidatus Woesearchaeota archaeon]